MKTIFLISLLLLFFLVSCISDKEKTISVEEKSEIKQAPQEPLEKKEIVPEEKIDTPPTYVKVENTTLQIIAPPTPEKKEVIVKGNIFTYEPSLKVWRTYLSREGMKQNLTFRYTPEQVKNIVVTGTLNSTFDKRKIFITFDPLNTHDLAFVALAAQELSSHLAGSFQRIPLSACTQEAKSCTDLVTCDDKDKAVIFLNNQPGPLITLDHNCLVLTGQGEDIMKAAERIIFDWYGYYK